MTEAQALLARVTPIVVTYNSAHCLPGLSGALSGFAHCVVVDNASTDNTVAQVGTLLARAHCIALPRNLGFGAANNRGAAEVSTEYILLINPDCTADPSTFCALVEAADHHPECSAVGPSIVDTQGKVQTNYRWKRSTWAPKGPMATGLVCVGFISGACTLIRKTAWLRVSGFDETFFLYYEDDDLSVRLARDAGPLLIEPASRVVHQSRGSVGGKARVRGEYLRGFHHIQSKFVYAQKHLGGAPAPLQRWRYALLGAVEAMLRLLLLDQARAARAWGRTMGVLKWKSP